LIVRLGLKLGVFDRRISNCRRWLLDDSFHADKRRFGQFVSVLMDLPILMSREHQGNIFGFRLQRSFQ
jgi:hypothetical protein